MAEQGFLKRWSRRKQRQAQRAPKAAQTQPLAPRQDQAAPDVPAPATQHEQAQPPLERPLPAIDLAQPGALQALLRADAPAELTRAALRHAWRSDPAIRDFIGLSENSFDFSAPELPGFGPLSAEQVQQLLAQAGGMPQQTQAPANTKPESQSVQVLPASVAAPAGGSPTVATHADASPALQHEKAAEEAAGVPRPKHHGSALPK